MSSEAAYLTLDSLFSKAPNKVLAVSAKSKLFEKLSNKFMTLDLDDILLTQCSTTLNRMGTMLKVIFFIQSHLFINMTKTPSSRSRSFFNMCVRKKLMVEIQKNKILRTPIDNKTGDVNINTKLTSYM
ncbi:unnamed protein product [Schistosoma curassoni]|uniref:Uncharacterized protein n=1 Tax=Schistosoma curassoni TaxID=6186 RepID=A0A183K929_9TREM|nr:unnamed protein product [Schistosoma curassoni]